MAALCELRRNGVAPFRRQLVRSRYSGCGWLPGPSHIHKGGLSARGPSRGHNCLPCLWDGHHSACGSLPCLWHQRHLPAAYPMQARASRRLQAVGCRTPSSRAAHWLVCPFRL